MQDDAQPRFDGAAVTLPAANRRRSRLGPSFIIGLALGPGLDTSRYLQAQSRSVTGVVVDQQGQRPVPRAVIQVVTSGQETLSDSAGRFVHRGIRPGTHLVHVRAVGYRSLSVPIVVTDTGVVDVRLELQLLAYDIGAVVVEGERGGVRFRDFEHRRQLGIGHFITSEEIQRRPSRTLAEVLRAVPGVQVTCRVYACDIRMARGCRPEYFLDGFPATFATGPDFPVQGIRGIEIYRTKSDTPTEFQRSGSTCGTIVIWSRPDL